MLDDLWLDRVPADRKATDERDVSLHAFNVRKGGAGIPFGYVAGVILARAQSSSRVRVIGTFDLKTDGSNA